MNYENTTKSQLSFSLGGRHYIVPAAGIVGLPDPLTKQIAKRGLPLAKTEKEATVRAPEPATGVAAEFAAYRSECEKFMAAAREKLGIGPTDSVLDAIDDLMGTVADAEDSGPAPVAPPAVVESQPEKKSGKR